MIPLVFLSLTLIPAGKATLSQARDALLEGNFYQAENILNSLQHYGNETLTPVSLYRGLIAQSMGHLCESEHLFQTAMTETRDEKLQKEIILSLGLNAVLETNIEKLENTLALGKKNGGFSAHFLFLKGMLEYAKGDYKAALQHFTAYKEALKTHENLYWIDDLYQKMYGRDLLELYIAHALLEENEIESAREILKKSVKAEANSLLGLSYLLEIKSLKNTENSSYYHLAGCYFERSTEFLLFSKEKILKHIESSLQEIEWPSQTALNYLQLLEKWKERSVLETFATHISSFIAKGSEMPDLKQKDFPLFMGCLNKEMVKLIRKTHLEELSLLWDRIQTMDFDFNAIGSHLETEMLAGIAKDDERLQATQRMLKVWELLVQDQEKRNLFAFELIHEGKLLWLKSGEEKKGTKLLKTGISLMPQDDQGDQARIQLRFFENLYVQAENANLIKRLLLIHEALETLNLELPIPPHPTTVGNYLADADYLFRARNYCSSMMHAQLIMKMDPDNEEALRLYGLSLYHMGEYQRALSALKKLTYPDDYAEKALMLSIAHSKSEQERHLVQVDRLDTLSEDE